jgi:hypothetical protein
MSKIEEFTPLPPLTIVEELRRECAGHMHDRHGFGWVQVSDLLGSLISAAHAEGVAEGKAEALANPISRGTLYVNTGGVGDLPDGEYPIITVLAPTKEKP